MSFSETISEPYFQDRPGCPRRPSPSSDTGFSAWQATGESVTTNHREIYDSSDYLGQLPIPIHLKEQMELYRRTCRRRRQNSLFPQR